MKFEIEAVPLPAAKPVGGGKKESMYVNADIREAALALEVGVNTFVIPTMAGTTVKKMNSNIAWRLNKEADTTFEALAEKPEGAVARKYSSRIELNAAGEAIGVRIGRKA